MRAILAALALFAIVPQFAFAWGDDGHKVVALIAQHYMTPDVRRTVDALLAQDADPLTAHDIASAATWADKYRTHHRETATWHFVDIELDHPSIDSACGGRPPLSQSVVASNGPPACILDKIKQFSNELASPNTDPEERVVALKYLLHFVGDMHQPLHSADNHDKGGNQVKVTVEGFPHRSRDELHAFWDTQFVQVLGASPQAIAKQLVDRITPDEVKAWSSGSFDDWAMEAFKIAKTDVYHDPPLSQFEPQYLDAAYVDQAVKDVSLQLSRAGVRLAAVLGKALASNTLTSTDATTTDAPKTDATKIDARKAGGSTSDTNVSTTNSIPTAPDNHPTSRTSDGANDGTDQFATEAEARGRCASETIVWANLRSSVYHFAGYPNYGNTKRGAYMCEADATRQGMHAAKAEQHP
jgi:hypothetical protein